MKSATVKTTATFTMLATTDDPEDFGIFKDPYWRDKEIMLLQKIISETFNKNKGSRSQAAMLDNFKFEVFTENEGN